MTYRCARCQYRTDDNDQAGEHARDTGHWRCCVCARSLQPEEPQTCVRCVAKTRADLADIAFAYAMLDDVIGDSSFRSMALPGGDALVMHSDGNAAGLKPYKPSDKQPRPGVDYPPLLGRYVVHPAYTDDRPVPDGKEHYADHWPSDPTSVLALLEVNERDWRDVFGHGPSASIATVTGCIDYLQKWLDLAANTHGAFDEFVADIRTLHHRLTRVAGSADIPLRAPAACFDCGQKRLVRVYGFRGLTDDWECSHCRRVYDQESYFLALRAAATDSEGWVAITDAAVACRQPIQRVRNWVDRLKVASRCDLADRRIYVWWPDVHDKATTSDAERRQLGMLA